MSSKSKDVSNTSSKSKDVSNTSEDGESKDVSNTSEQNMAFTGSIHDDNCDTGDKVISSRKKLEKHMAKKHKQRRKHTGEFRERSVNRLHFRQEHEVLDKKCEHCDYSAGTNQHLWRHIRNKHSDMENLQVEMLKCTECNEEFFHQEKLTDHFQNFHAGSSPINSELAQRKCTEDEHNKFRCNTCEEVFTNNEKLKDHMNRSHTCLLYTSDAADE